MKKALFVWGGWEGHEPKQCVGLFAQILKSSGYVVAISDSLDSYLDVENMGSYDLIVQAITRGSITPKQLKGLQTAVFNGAGLAGWHGGLTASFRVRLSNWSYAQ